MTYQDLVNRIQDITNQHKMLVDFGYGDISDLKVRFENTSGDAKVQADYPYLFLNPQSHTRNSNSVTYNFNMIVMDMAREEVSDQPYNNMLAIQSQCQQYIDDIIAYLKYAYDDAKTDVQYTNLSYQPFNERFQDDVAGMTASFSVVIASEINECVAPINPKETLINRVFINVEECPAFDTAFRVGARTTDYPQYTETYNEFYARFDEPLPFEDCYSGKTILAINDRNSTTEPYYKAGNRRWWIPQGVTGLYRFDFDLQLTNVQGIDLSQDQFWIQVIVNGQQQTYTDLPALPVDGTIVNYQQSFEIDAGQDTDEIVILFRYRDQGTPAPDGPIVGYTGTAKIQRITA